jgi:hypothetical protein
VATVGSAPRVFPADGSCSVDGDGGDTLLNDQKNRFVPPAGADVNRGIKAADDIISLPVPSDVQSQQRSAWSSQDSAQIGALESTAAVVEGYLVAVTPEDTGTGESCNCHRPKVLYDYHIFLSGTAGVPKSEAVVVEMTPRWRSIHPSWQDVNNIKKLVTQKMRVRVTGWLLLDEDHRDQVGLYRATVWEIHPVTKLEYAATGSAWTEL